eukprot:maker-scaffold_10-snap-gene-3.35-mRNA-1 protein AED:0.00 eAED:0.00 QI:98/1/1/1/1/1/2/109/546
MGVCKNLWNMFKHPSSEVTAWLKVTSARGPLTVVASLYTATALTFLAEQLDTDCDERINIGFLTLNLSSILSAASFVENITNAILSPIWGSVADSTSHRKGLAIFSASTWVGCVFLGALIMLYAYIEESSLALLWFFFITFLITAIFYELALLLLFAYLPEVVKNEEELVLVTAKQYAIVNGLQLVGAFILVAIAFVIGDEFFDNDLPFSIMAHLFVVVVFLILAIPGFRGLPSREKQKKTILNDQGEEVELKATKNSFGELIATLKEVKNKYPQIGIYLLSWMFYFAGVAAVVVLQVVFVQDEFDYDTTDVAVLGAVVLIFSVVGNLWSRRLSKTYSNKTLLLGSVIMFMCLAFAAPFLMVGQERDEVEIENETSDVGCIESTVLEREATFLGVIFSFVFSVMGGLGIGIVYPMSTAIYAVIIPGGKEASYFGLKTFGAKVISWAPPLVFTFINEATDDVKVAFLSLGFWFLASIPFLLMLDVDKGMKDIEHTLDMRRGAGGKRRNSVAIALNEVKTPLQPVVDDLIVVEDTEKRQEEMEKKHSI